MENLKKDLLPAIIGTSGEGEGRPGTSAGNIITSAPCTTSTANQDQGGILVYPNQLDAVISGSVDRAVSAHVERIQRETMRHAAAVVHLSQASSGQRNPYRWSRRSQGRPWPPRATPAAPRPRNPRSRNQRPRNRPPPPLMGLPTYPPVHQLPQDINYNSSAHLQQYSQQPPYPHISHPPPIHTPYQPASYSYNPPFTITYPASYTPLPPSHPPHPYRR